ncbi:hypothetical protein TNCT_131701 [Trichonephila clavata]|uniref:Uncharacterized protein n=1 Tax=Trichonephila clavata TaxID=2740835 RepID=A0A8X6H0P9_TRICU|nr:hypothetical protein TNCT_131701 [Trichonephila clavata]
MRDDNLSGVILLPFIHRHNNCSTLRHTSNASASAAQLNLSFAAADVFRTFMQNSISMKFTHLDGIQDLKKKGKALCAAAFNTPSSYVALAIKFNGGEMSRDAEKLERSTA